MAESKKNPHAVALAKLSHDSLTPVERQARARRAIHARWNKSRPTTWTVIDIVNNWPNVRVLFSSDRRSEAVVWKRKHRPTGVVGMLEISSAQAKLEPKEEAG